jgi:pyrroline-5-carboxylate reductase
VTGADTVLIAVKPPVVPAVLSRIRPLLDTQLVISIAAGVTLASLRALPDRHCTARVMPNTPALVGAGVSAVCFDQADAGQQSLVKGLLSACGVSMRFRNPPSMPLPAFPEAVLPTSCW